MKSLQYIILTFICSFYILNAADWDVIVPENVSYFISPDSAFHVIDIQNEIKAESGIEYYNFYSNEITMGPVNRPNCVIEKGAGWLGRYVFIGQNYCFFKNKDNETIQFEINARQGDSWILMDLDFGNYVKATVVEISEKTIFGTSDSVKKIELGVYNNKDESVNSKLNGRFFLLSKNHGMTSMFNMFHFPDSLGQYHLIGFNDGATSGIEPIKYIDVFDFDIGDEFHIYEGDTTENNNGVLVFRRLIVLNKTYFENERTFDYEVEQKVMQVRFAGQVFDTVYNDNFVHIRINLDDYQDYIPEQSYLTDFNDRDSTLTSNMIFTGMYDGRQVIIPWIRYEFFKHPCYVYSPNSSLRQYHYIEGCGEFFEEAYWFGKMWKRLVYLKKGDKEWGKRLDFVVGVEENTDKQSINIQQEVRNNELILQSEISSIFHLSVYSNNGRFIFSEKINLSVGTNIIPLAKCTNGVYLVILKNDNDKYNGKILVTD